MGCNQLGSTFDESVLKDTLVVSFPIESPEEAIAHAKTEHFFEKMPRVKLRTIGYKDFGIYVSVNNTETKTVGKEWLIHYYARGLIPSFSCTISLAAASGSVLSGPACGYNK